MKAFSLFFCNAVLALLFILPCNVSSLYTGFLFQNASSLTSVTGAISWSDIRCSYDGSIVYTEVENGDSYHSLDSGSTWTKTAGPACFSGQCTLVALSGNGKYVYKGGFNSLFKSSDSGASFDSLSLPYTFPAALITDESGQYVLVSEYFTTTRISLSSDYGATFSVLSAFPAFDVKAFGGSFDFSNLIALSSGQGSNNHVRIHYSKDRGASWTLSETDFFGGWYGDFSVGCDWTCKYAAVSGPYNLDGKGIWYTSNYGQSWSLVSQPSSIFQTYSIVADRTGRYMLAGTGKDSLAVFFSNDFGHTWTQTTNQKGSYISLAVHKNFTTGYALSGKGDFSDAAPYNILKGVAIIPPTATPTAAPTFSPSAAPSVTPTKVPTNAPTFIPTAAPTTARPSANPSFTPSAVPTAAPTQIPTAIPTTVAPTASPTFAPSAIPSIAPTPRPSAHPTLRPSAVPTAAPTQIPTALPTSATRTRVTLSCNATITGISSSAFDVDYRDGFEYAVESSVLDGQRIDSHVTGVKTGSRRRLLFSFVSHKGQVVKPTAANIVVTFNVSTILEETGLNTATAFDTIFNSLKTKFSSGVIQTKINDFVDDAKSGTFTPVVLLSVSSSKAEVTYEVIQSKQSDSSSNDDGLSTTNIIIIVVLVTVGGIVIIAAGVYFFFRSSYTSYNTVHQTENNNNNKAVEFAGGNNNAVVAKENVLNI